MKSKKTNLGFTLNDLSKIKRPPPPDFGNDDVGRIATYMYANRKAAQFHQSILNSIRRTNKEIGNARKKTQKAWEKMVPSLIADRNLLDILRSKNLIEPFLEITEIIVEGHKRIPDDGSPAFEPHILSAICAADELFPGWESDPSRTLARTLNDGLQRAGFDGGDKTESIRVALIKESKIRNFASKVNFPNWKPPKL
jgi:hypothetical protein